MQGRIDKEYAHLSQMLEMMKNAEATHPNDTVKQMKDGRNRVLSYLFKLENAEEPSSEEENNAEINRRQCLK